MGRALLVIACAACATARADDKPDYATHVKALRADLAKKGIGKAWITVEEPFVVVGDGSAEDFERGLATVRWARDHLERDFFDHRPEKILDVFLFHDAASYEHGVRALTGESPTTPYGFYSSEHAGLFMNIATGGGTLVHEIVHPYVEADFPGAPPWLNEGLGSLFEQSDDRDGHIVGLPNWRLPALQRAVAHGQAPSFKSLIHLGTNEFYGDDSGMNYAEARYLLYYVQDKGLVRDFYRAFRAARKKDPSGYATLFATLGERDDAEFRARWERFVTALRF